MRSITKYRVFIRIPSETMSFGITNKIIFVKAQHLVNVNQQSITDTK